MVRQTDKAFDTPEVSAVGYIVLVIQTDKAFDTLEVSAWSHRLIKPLTHCRSVHGHTD